MTCKLSGTWILLVCCGYQHLTGRIDSFQSPREICSDIFLQCNYFVLSLKRIHSGFSITFSSFCTGTVLLSTPALSIGEGRVRELWLHISEYTKLLCAGEMGKRYPGGMKLPKRRFVTLLMDGKTKTCTLEFYFWGISFWLWNGSGKSLNWRWEARYC